MKYSLVIALLLTSCVSVRLEKPKTNYRAKNYSLVSPQNGFLAKSKDNFDRYWIHSGSGNTISLQTSCGSNDPSLEALLLKSTYGINITKELSKKHIRYNDREGLQAIQNGTVDGVAVTIKTLVFKKNHCNYTISYFGLQENLLQNQKDFDSFLSNFRVQ